MKLKYLLPVFLIFQNCISQNLEEYFYPVSKFSNGKTYKYKALKDQNEFLMHLTYKAKDSLLLIKNTLMPWGFKNSTYKIDKKGWKEVSNSSLLHLNITRYLFLFDKNPYSYKTYSKNTGLPIFETKMVFSGFSKLNVLGKERKALLIKMIYKGSFDTSHIVYFYYAKNIGLAKLVIEYTIDNQKHTSTYILKTIV